MAPATQQLRETVRTTLAMIDRALPASPVFRAHFRLYCVVMAFLCLIWLFTGGGYFWPIWPAMGWGLGVTIQGMLVGGKRSGGGSHAEAMSTDAQRRPAEEQQGTRIRAAPASSRRREWVTVLFTDIVSSTSLNAAIGDDEWSRFLTGHRAKLRSAFRDRGGTEVGSQGDGLLARFTSPADAVLCAIDIQRGIEETKEAGGIVPLVRIGIHAGEAIGGDDGDIIGRVVNLAARITSEASPGEILITEPIADELADRIELEDRGLRPLRGVPQARHLLAVRWS